MLFRHFSVVYFKWLTEVSFLGRYSTMVEGNCRGILSPLLMFYKCYCTFNLFLCHISLMSYQDLAITFLSSLTMLRIAKVAIREARSKNGMNFLLLWHSFLSLSPIRHLMGCQRKDNLFLISHHSLRFLELSWGPHKIRPRASLGSRVTDCPPCSWYACYCIVCPYFWKGFWLSAACWTRWSSYLFHAWSILTLWSRFPYWLLSFKGVKYNFLC